MGKIKERLVIKNSLTTLLAQSCRILLCFIVRKIFIQELGVANLGYNAVFINILEVMNLAELGIGVAVTSFLYLPISRNDGETVASIMAVFKRLYWVVGLIVFVLGLVVSAFLQKLIPDSQIPYLHIYIYFYLCLAGTLSTYFLAYYRTLLLAEQKAYVVSRVDIVAYLSMSLAQIAALKVWHSYVAYLIIRLVFTLLSNYIVCSYTKKRFHYGFPNVAKINEYKIKIKEFVKDVFVSRIGAVIFYSTDSIIISTIKGSVLAGLLSNYTLITTQINYIVSQVLSAVQGTFGVYISENDDRQKQKRMTEYYSFVNFYIANICFNGILFCIQPFEELFVGKQYCLDTSTVILLALNLFLTILLQIPSQIFTVYKLYKHDRSIIAISATLNVVLSVLFVQILGIVGVLIGTFITSVIYLVSRINIISKVVFEISPTDIWLRYLKYFITSLLNAAILCFTILNISSHGIVLLTVRFFMVIFLSTIVPALVWIRSDDMKYLIREFVPNKITNFLKNKFVFAIGITVVVTVILFFHNGVDLNFYEIGNSNKSVCKNVDSKKTTEILGDGKCILSFDDTICVFEDLTAKQELYKSIFENDFLFWMRQMHERYGAKFTCYVFYENADTSFNLSQCTRKYRDEFEENSEWLKFAFHSFNNREVSSKNGFVYDFMMVNENLRQIVGGNSIDNYLRIHGFIGKRDDIVKIRSMEPNMLVGFYTSDDRRDNYDLTHEENEFLYTHDKISGGEINYVSSDLRVEYIDNVERKLDEFETELWNNQREYLVIFSHEWAFDRKVKKDYERIIEFARDSNYSFSYGAEIDY